MIDQIEALQNEALERLTTIETQDALESWRVQYLGKKGALTAILRGLGTLVPSDRPVVGQIANRVKESLEAEFSAREAQLQQAERQRMLATEHFDVTLPGRPIPSGQRHPVTLILQEIADAFTSMGFQIVEGPEVESERYNFELLNIPAEHPARDMWDTFYVAPTVRSARDQALR